MNIKKEIFKRGFLGALAGIAISATIFLIIAWVSKESSVYSGVPLGFFIKSYLASLIIGFTIAACSTIFEIERWSLAKQTLIHFIIVVIVFFGAGAYAEWITMDTTRFLIYVANFVVTYGVIFISRYVYLKKKTKEINEKLAG